MTERIEALARAVDARLSEKITRLPSLPDELAYEVKAASLIDVCRTLRDAPELRFEMLMDVAGVDFLTYGRDEWQTVTATRTGFSRGRVADRGLPVAPSGGRFAVAYQLLSITHRHRLRLRAHCPDDEDPVIDSVADVWPSANWFERETFDLFGIIFRGHPDLRRLLTDYGFIGHPFRKDFPLSGNVEVRYDEVKKRVVYQPVTIEPRTLVPKVIRNDHRYDPELRTGVARKSAG